MEDDLKVYRNNCELGAMDGSNIPSGIMQTSLWWKNKLSEPLFHTFITIGVLEVYKSGGENFFNDNFHSNGVVKNLGGIICGGHGNPLEKKQVPEDEYELLKDYVNPSITIKAGVKKTVSEWLIKMPILSKEDFDIKTDWFRKVDKKGDTHVFSIKDLGNYTESDLVELITFLFKDTNKNYFNKAFRAFIESRDIHTFH